MNNEKTLILLTDSSPLLDEELFNKFFIKVNPERQEDIKKRQKTEDKILSLSGGLLLDQLLKEKGIKGQISHTQEGKPYIKGIDNIYISLTHCYPYAAAIISGAPCGIDIERRDHDLRAVVRRFYNDREKDLCKTDDTTAYDIWCCKECYIKFDKPQDIRLIDTTKTIPDYAYHSFPLTDYSFIALFKGEDYSYQLINLNGGPE